MMKGEFEIPNDIKTDLAYCQQAIANHVKFHQVNFLLRCISILFFSKNFESMCLQHAIDLTAMRPHHYIVHLSKYFHIHC